MNLDEAACHFETDKGTKQKRGGPGHGYSLVYAREFARFGVPCDGLAGIAAEKEAQTRPPVLLEVGVQAGCSMRLWNWYLPEFWKIVGLEVALMPGIVEAVKATAVYPDRIFIEQADSCSFADCARVAAAHAPFDIIIDDGDHFPRSQLNTLVNLWPHLRKGGIYCIEDLHESFWDEVYPDNPDPRGDLFTDLLLFVKDCVGRGRYATWGPVPPMPAPDPAQEGISSVRFYRNMVVLEKRA